jgi:hypothetical protein
MAGRGMKGINMENHADLIFLNGNVITVDADNLEAEAVAISGDKILAVGSNEEISVLKVENTQIIDLKGQILLPGFIDCHTHFLQMGISLSYLDLRGTSSIDDVLDRIRERAKETKEGEWIVCHRWDESKWKEKRYITRFDIDKITSDNPIMLKRMDGHLWVVNTRGLECAGISPDQLGVEKEPSTGELTGLLRWGAKNAVAKCLTLSRDQMTDSLKLAVDEALKHGVTTVHEFVADIPLYQAAASSSHLLVRIYMGVGEDIFSGGEMLKSLSPDLREIETAEFGSKLLRLGPVKMFADGSIGARTAALFEPYNDDPSTSGQLATTPDNLKERISKTHAVGAQLAVHAIGDRGIETLLNAFEYAMKENPRKNHRHRIEHAEMLNDDLMDRIKELDLVLSVQPNFIGEWGGPGELYEKRLGDRYRNLNPFRAILDRDISMAFGSDCMPFSPIYGIWSAVNNPVEENRISLNEAIYCYTLGAAYSSFEENLKGSVKTGKLADLVILASNSLTEDGLNDIKVKMTMVGGKIVYTAKSQII